MPDPVIIREDLFTLRPDMVAVAQQHMHDILARREAAWFAEMMKPDPAAIARHVGSQAAQVRRQPWRWRRNRRILDEIGYLMQLLEQAGD